MFYGSTPAASNNTLTHAETMTVLAALDSIGLDDEEFDSLLDATDLEIASLVGTIALLTESLRPTLNPIAARLMEGLS